MGSALFSDRYGELVASLRELRLAKGVTQAELAKRLARPQSFVSKIERRERRIDPVEMHDWATALGVSPVDAFALIAARPAPTFSETS
jgi:transcriptional regulator with XRE-family HTH domain